MKIAWRGQKAALSVPLGRDNLSILRACPSEYTFSGSVLIFEPTIEALKHFKKNFPNTKGFDHFCFDAEEKPPIRMLKWALDWEPYEHQKEAFKQSWNKAAFMYRMGVQTGKSALSILNASWLAYKGHIDAVLIIAPSGVQKKWITEEYAKFWPFCVPSCAAYWSSTSLKKEKTDLEEALNTDKVSVIAVNIEALSASNKRAEKIIQSWMLKHNVFVILDESHQIKSPTAKRTRAVFRLGKLAKFKRTLTGTAGQPLDYYSQYNFLNPNILGFSTYTAFKSHFAIMINIYDRDGKEKTDRRGKPIKIVAADPETGKKKYRNIEQLRNMVEPYSFTIATEQCNELPPRIYKPVPFEMTKEQRKFYNDIRDDLIIEFEGNEISAPLAIQKMIRLRQILGGFLPDEDGESKAINKVNRRIEAAFEAIQKLDEGPIIVWASFKPEIKAIAERLRQEYGEKQVVTYYGEDNKRVREKDRERFQDGDVRFFVSNPACGGIGFSLFISSQMLFYSNGYDLKQRQQAEGRILATAQAAKRCTYLDVIAEGTIDERVLNALLNKYEVEARLTGQEALSWLQSEN